jgi:hypothetical protein
MRSIRIPETPHKSEFARSIMLARTSAIDRRPPAPAFRNHKSVSCNSHALSAEIAVFDLPPKPVVTP